MQFLCVLKVVEGCAAEYFSQEVMLKNQRVRLTKQSIPSVHFKTTHSSNQGLAWNNKRFSQLSSQENPCFCITQVCLHVRKVAKRFQYLVKSLSQALCASLSYLQDNHNDGTDKDPAEILFEQLLSFVRAALCVDHSCVMITFSRRFTVFCFTAGLWDRVVCWRYIVPVFICVSSTAFKLK